MNQGTYEVKLAIDYFNDDVSSNEKNQVDNHCMQSCGISNDDDNKDTVCRAQAGRFEFYSSSDQVAM